MDCVLYESKSKKERSLSFRRLFRPPEERLALLAAPPPARPKRELGKKSGEAATTDNKAAIKATTVGFILQKKIKS